MSRATDQTVVISRVTMPWTSILGCIFVAAKLFDKIDWSWWYVLMPFYIVPVAVICAFLLALLFAVLCLGIAGVIEHFQMKKRIAKREQERQHRISL